MGTRKSGRATSNSSEIVTTIRQPVAVYEYTMQIPVRDLKARLSHYLAKVREGANVEVTLHKKPVARLTAVTEPAASGPRRLVALGLAQWAGGKPKGAAERLARGGTPVSTIVLQDRG